MKYLKLFEDYKVNNITIDDIINVIKNNGYLYSDVLIDDNPDHKHNPEDKLIPVDIDDDGMISIDINGDVHYAKLEWVNRIEW